MGKPPAIQARQANGSWIVWDQYRNQFLRRPHTGPHYETQEQAEEAARQIRRQQRARFYCLDCGVHTSRIREYYMVRRQVWREANPAGRGMLCITDLENRIGRRLQPDDFIDCCLNREQWRKSFKLKDRMSNQGEQ